MQLIMARNKVALAQVGDVHTPAPTESHSPISHIGLIERLRHALTEAGATIEQEEHALARGGLRYFGGFSILAAGMTDEARRLVVGLRNAHDKSFAASACIGNLMMVCDNLCFSSDVKLARKHTKNILADLPRVLAEVVGGLLPHWTAMEDRIARYSEIELSRDEAAGLTVALADAKAIPARIVYPINSEFANPRHEEFKGGTLWTLYNAVTENLKGGDLSKLPRRTMVAQSLFDKRASFALTLDATTGEVVG